MLLTLHISEVLPATPRARIVRIALDGAAFPYLPGQALMLGAPGNERRKPYSIARPPEDAARDDFLELLIGIDLDGQSGSPVALEPGTVVDVEGPLGRFTFPGQPDERRFLFIAGGTGIAPLRAMLYRALHIPHEHVGLLYSARTAGDFAYEAEFRELARRRRIELTQTVTRENASEGWTGARGRLGRADLTPLVHHKETLCFVCGPGALVKDMLSALAELGLARDRIKTEEWA